jgi:hypothetical protein
MPEVDAFLANCRLADGRLVDIGISGGTIAEVGEDAALLSNSAPALDMGGDLALPGIVDGHMHLDKTLIGLPWLSHAAGPTRMSRIETDKTILPHLPPFRSPYGEELADLVAASGGILGGVTRAVGRGRSRPAARRYRPASGYAPSGSGAARGRTGCGSRAQARSGGGRSPPPAQWRGNPRLLCRGTRSSNPSPSSRESGELYRHSGGNGAIPSRSRSSPGAVGHVTYTSTCLVNIALRPAPGASSQRIYSRAGEGAAFPAPD